jgi:hypothetical protein
MKKKKDDRYFIPFLAVVDLCAFITLISSLYTNKGADTLIDTTIHATSATRFPNSVI